MTYVSMSQIGLEIFGIAAAPLMALFTLGVLVPIANRKGIILGFFLTVGKLNYISLLILQVAPCLMVLPSTLSYVALLTSFLQLCVSLNLY